MKDRKGFIISKKNKTALKVPQGLGCMNVTSGLCSSRLKTKRVSFLSRCRTERQPTDPIQ